ncbi:MAG: acyl-CoA dehydrogenase family protein, partial [Acidimicrobiales bacterium]
MDLTPTPEQQAFRSEVRTWLMENLPWDYGHGLPPRFEDLSEEVAFLRRWQASLAAGGWVGVAWPVAYGGRGAGPNEHFILQEELARARAPEMVGRIGLNLAAPTLLAHGTDEQKDRWLSRIRTADDLWCQLFSEPGAGSDLAGVSTRAARVEGGWLVNGQKVWTSYAQFADWGVCLARTDPEAPKHKGI